jgi:ribonuclease HII
MILGVDEVGRGSWAGPLVVGAVVLGGINIPGLTDSKKLTKKQREELNAVIHSKAKGIGIGWVSAEEIDKIGLSKALNKATQMAVEQITIDYDEIIIDGTVNFLKDTDKSKLVKTMKKADLLIPSVSAASIVAKVARDRFMAEQDTVYPGYKFRDNVGYGTHAHSSTISKIGLTSIHRKSYWPIRNYIKTGEVTTRQIGLEAESIACEYLLSSGHELIDRNWKTKYCEIDIVSRLGSTLYFSEVKYRKSSDQGGGLSAITAKKMKQMQFAVKLYVASNKADDFDLRLAAISMSGTPPRVLEFLEI